MEQAFKIKEAYPILKGHTPLDPCHHLAYSIGQSRTASTYNGCLGESRNPENAVFATPKIHEPPVTI